VTASTASSPSSALRLPKSDVAGCLASLREIPVHDCLLGNRAREEDGPASGKRTVVRPNNIGRSWMVADEDDRTVSDEI
jgi:hypothetical protein